MNIFFQNSFQRGFGTWPLRGDEARNAIRAAAEAGYRAFDTAQSYENEAETGEALAATGLSRDSLCITTKVQPRNFDPARFLPSVEVSLKALRVDYVDVLLVHWPPADGQIELSLRLLEDALKRGLTRHIGVSNYTAGMLREARSILDAPIATNQVEFHPLLDQSRLLSGAIEAGVPLSAYCSVARGEIFRYPEFAGIGAGYGKSAAQVALRWILQKGVSVNTMSTKPENIRANFDIMDFTLSAIDMARINALSRTNYRIVTREIVPGAPDWD